MRHASAPGPEPIDLHLHTTASDGRCTPEELVARVQRAGLRAFSVTDHDTVAALPRVSALAARAGLELLPGIEISAVRDGRDVHVLGYCFDAASGTLLEFLHAQRTDRVGRLSKMAERLAELGVPIDIGPLLEQARRHPDRAFGRPQVARALVEAGRTVSIQDAFDRFLATGGPAYVPRRAVSPAEVVSVIRTAGGVASLAHPGLLGRDEWIPEFAQDGLTALEVYHCDHDATASARYRALADGLDLAVSGGSDYHGEAAGRPSALGAVTLPAADYERLLARAAAAGCPGVPARVRTG